LLRGGDRSATTQRQHPAARDAWAPAGYTPPARTPAPAPPAFQAERSPDACTAKRRKVGSRSLRAGLQHGRHRRPRAGRRRRQAAAAAVIHSQARACCSAGSHWAAGRCRRSTRATSASAALACAASSRHSAASGASACRAAPGSGPAGRGRGKAQRACAPRRGCRRRDCGKGQGRAGGAREALSAPAPPADSGSTPCWRWLRTPPAQRQAGAQVRASPARHSVLKFTYRSGAVQNAPAPARPAGRPAPRAARRPRRAAAPAAAPAGRPPAARP